MAETAKKAASLSRPLQNACIESTLTAKPVKPISADEGQFPIVGIGASAGGLGALEELFTEMPADTGMGFVVVTHQHPGYTSLLPELLRKCTGLKILGAADGLAVKPNCLYIGLPGGQLAIVNGVLHRMETFGRPEAPRLPIDYFFRSLAEDQKDRAICVILSGTGTDGTLGLKAIKGEAGMAMVQQVQSAKYAGMPSSAIATGLADYVLPAQDMAKQLLAYTRGYLTGTGAKRSAPMQKIFALVHQRTGHDFSLYKSSTVRRRVERRMNLHQIEGPVQYLRCLRDNPHEIDVLFKELLIGVTNFFRDPEAFDSLGKLVMSELLESRTVAHTMRFWVPGCASGEEVFSIAILICEAMEAANTHRPVQIFGTDLDPAAIRAARGGQYPVGTAVDVSAERLERYFVREDSAYRIREDIRKMAIFAVQNVIKDPPFAKLDLISCRNLLGYLNVNLQKRLLPVFHYALRPGGFLFLGRSETIGSFRDLFETVDSKWKIFRRREGVSPARLAMELPAQRLRAELAGDVKPAVLAPREPNFASIVDRLLVKKLFHELQVHQIELKLQNEELRQSHVQLAESRDRFNDLYDYAPVGYVTLGQDSRILQANLTAASLLGIARAQLIGQTFTHFIAHAAQDNFFLQQKVAIEARTKQVSELLLRRKDGATVNVQFETLYAEDPVQGSGNWRSTITDIAALKQAEEALRKSHTELEKRVETELKARTRQESAVAALSREALAGRDIGWLLREVVVVLGRVLEVEFSSVLELTPAGDELVLRAGVGWSKGCVGTRREPVREGSQASYTLCTDEPLLVEDLTIETRFRPAALWLDHSLVSEMSVVIHGRSQPYGILSVHSASKRKFDSHEAIFLQAIADVLAQATMRRQLEEKLLAVSSREQLRIGHDLHDGLCQQLAGIEFRTVVLAGKLAGNLDAREEVERIGAWLRDSMQHARILSRGLAPVDLEANGLMAALSQLATSCGQLYGVDCQFDCDQPVLIAAQEVATHLYRIAQEALTNAIKHGHAKTIIIGLRQTSGETLLTVTNDGSPLPPDSERRGGMGLQIMRYRADMIGATLHFESTRDGKTAVICSFGGSPPDDSHSARIFQDAARNAN
jgi:PAS domain S-box-containing protein